MRAMVQDWGILLFAANAQIQRFGHRITAEPEAVDALVEGNIRGAPRSDIGARLRL
jgi:hypothetical protein